MRHKSEELMQQILNYAEKFLLLNHRSPYTSEIADALGRIDTLTLRHALNELIALPEKIQRVLEQAPAIEQFAQRLCSLAHAYFIGRNLDYAVALEASLKL